MGRVGAAAAGILILIGGAWSLLGVLGPDSSPPSFATTAMPTASPVSEIDSTANRARDATPTQIVQQPTATPTAPVTPSPTPPPTRWLLSPMSHDYQTWNNCAPVAAMMALSYYGVALSQPQVAAMLRPHPDDKNVAPQEIVDYMAGFGLKGWVRLNGRLEVIKALVAQGFPVILHQLLREDDDIGHYTVARGYDDAAGVLIINDSYYGPTRRLAYEDFERLWQGFNGRYIPIYRPEDEVTVAALLGADADDNTMLSRALEEARRETARSPGSTYAWLNLGEVYYLQGDYPSAVAAWERADALELPARILWYTFWPVEAYNKLGQAEQVLAMTGPVLAVNPASAELLLERAKAYLALGDSEAAERELRQAAIYGPTLPQVREAMREWEASG